MAQGARDEGAKPSGRSAISKKTESFAHKPFDRLKDSVPERIVANLVYEAMKFIAPLASDDDDVSTPWVFAPKSPISHQCLLELLSYPLKGAKVLTQIAQAEGGGDGKGKGKDQDKEKSDKGTEKDSTQKAGQGSKRRKITSMGDPAQSGAEKHIMQKIGQRLSEIFAASISPQPSVFPSGAEGAET
eukprot:9468192-Pyramimonas_sp.AAC.1